MASASTAKDSTKEIKYFYSHTKRKNNGHFLAYEHPCKNFALPPPLPPNSKRIGPRRKSFEFFNVLAILIFIEVRKGRFLVIWFNLV